MDPTESIVAEFRGFVEDLTTPEKRNIVALTEIAREALHSQPQAVPGLAQVITDRILHAHPTMKLPALYLLDSVSKLVGEPYRTHFCTSLPAAFGVAWRSGAPRSPLEKLLLMWQGVFPEHVLTAARLEMQYLPLQYQQPAAGLAASQYPALTSTWVPPATDRYLAAAAPSQYAAPAPLPAAPAAPQYQAPVAPRYRTPPPGMCHPTPRPAPVAIPDLLSSLLAAGVLGATAPAVPGAAPSGKTEGGPSTAFSPDVIKSDNPAAVRRLMMRTTATKPTFLDVQFLRRAARSSATLRSSRLCVPVDEDQPACALSGETFDQVWDEEHQEWRYAGAVRLDAEQAQRYGLPPGSIVLHSALGGAAGAPPGLAIKSEGELHRAPSPKKEEEDAKAEAGVEAEEGPTARVKREQPDEDGGAAFLPDIKKIKLESEV